jgi:hypothetical protein
MTDGVLYGTCGVLAYDEATDRVQCHACAAIRSPAIRGP